MRVQRGGKERWWLPADGANAARRSGAQGGDRRRRGAWRQREGVAVAVARMARRGAGGGAGRGRVLGHLGAARRGVRRGRREPGRVLVARDRVRSGAR